MTRTRKTTDKVTRTRQIIEQGYAAALAGQPCKYPGSSEMDRMKWEQGWRSGKHELDEKAAQGKGKK